MASVAGHAPAFKAFAESAYLRQHFQAVFAGAPPAYARVMPPDFA
jgi:hypothetical protein